MLDTTSSNPLLEEETLSPRIIQHLTTTYKWARFVGVVSIIFAVLSFISGLVGLYSTINLYLTPGFEDRSASVLLLEVIFTLAFLGYGIYIAYLLVIYAGKTKEFVQTGDYQILGASFEAQLKYWRLISIFFTLSLALYFLALMFGIAAGAGAF